MSVTNQTHKGPFLTPIIWPMVYIAAFIHSGFIYGMYLFLSGKVKLYSFYWCKKLHNELKRPLMTIYFSSVLDCHLHYWRYSGIASLVFTSILQSHNADEIFRSSSGFHLRSSKFRRSL